jgi:hypothetical protein
MVVAAPADGQIIEGGYSHQPSPNNQRVTMLTPLATNLQEVL